MIFTRHLIYSKRKQESICRRNPAKIFVFTTLPLSFQNSPRFNTLAPSKQQSVAIGSKREGGGAAGWILTRPAAEVDGKELRVTRCSPRVCWCLRGKGSGTGEHARRRSGSAAAGALLWERGRCRGVVRRGWGARAVEGRSGGMGSSWRRQWWAQRRREGQRRCVRVHGKPRALKGTTMMTQRCTPR
jgi:hypothetical protein